MMSPDRLKALLSTYRDGLLNDTLPFWIPRAIDREYGGSDHSSIGSTPLGSFPRRFGDTVPFFLLPSSFVLLP